MSLNLARILAEDFLKNSWQCIQNMVETLATFKGNKNDVNLHHWRNGQKNDVTVSREHFFLRSSVEYSNPHLTVEEVQGILAARLLEVCGNYFHECGLHQPDGKDIDEICERLKKPSQGKIVSFLLNTDEVEPDRYSMNPLKESIMNSGQSAFPSAYVKTEQLHIDQGFVQKYEGSLISKGEIELIARHLETCRNNYMDMVDGVKYEQLNSLSETFGIDLCIYSTRMPLTTLQKESPEEFLHHLIRQTHRDYQSIERVYDLVGRSMKSRTTLLTVPHSSKGYGSKRAAKGKLYFSGDKLKNVKVDYETTPLYPNAIDPSDVSIAKADDHFTVEADKFTAYTYAETPSSPQFFLYSLASPENAALWHGIGAFGASQLLKSYINVHLAGSRNELVENLTERYGISTKIPLQFNLIPEKMWFHPIHRNIDASIGCIPDLKFLARLGMRMEFLATSNFLT